MQTAVLITLAILAFAANSVICRMALSYNYIDPLSFAAIRILSGATLLFIMIKANKAVSRTENINWYGPFSLLVYVIAFTLAYTQLGTSEGAIILFSTVQLSLVGWGMSRGEKLNLRTAIGFCLASGGLVYFVWPTMNSPSFNGAVLMALAGMAWSVYTIAGKNTKNPLDGTAKSFIACIPMAFILLFVASPQSVYTVPGVILAIASGAYASGIGYVFWYRAIRHISFTQASVAQFMVPIAASIGGILFLAEPLSPRIAIASAIIMAGIALVVRKRATVSDSGAH